MLNVLDLFAGIGGFSLGLERTNGFRTVAFCEIDKKAQLVLRKHWPNTPIFDDVTTLTKGLLDERGISIDVITGGFPCQDISLAGKGAGLEGERSGLWFQFHRLIQEIQPRYAIIENVSALRSRGLDAVLRGLVEIGYDAEWHCIPAAAVGAPHQRDRIWIVAYSACQWGQQCRRLQLTESSIIERYIHYWSSEPSVGRVANGVPNRVDRLKQLGNAVVPQIPQLIGEAILQAERAA